MLKLLTMQVVVFVVMLVLMDVVVLLDVKVGRVVLMLVLLQVWPGPGITE